MSHWKLSRPSSFNLGLGPESVQWFLSESTLPFSLPIILLSLSLSLGPADSGPSLFPCAFPTVAVSLGTEGDDSALSRNNPSIDRLCLTQPWGSRQVGPIPLPTKRLAGRELLTTLPLSGLSFRSNSSQ